MSSAGSPLSSRPDLRDRVQQLKLPAPEASRGRSGWFLKLLLAALAGWFFAAWWYDADDLLFRSFRKSAAAPTSAASKLTAANSGETKPKDKLAEQAPPKQDTIALEAKGYIIPAHQILVSPKVSGMITRLCIEEGLRMQKGDILAEIETTEYQAEYDRIRALRDLSEQKLLELQRGFRKQELDQARAELKQGEETLAETKDNYDRQVTLRKSQASTEQAFVQAERRYQAQQQRVEMLKQGLALMEEGPRIERINAAKAELRQTEAEVARAKWRLDNCTIRAPISGTILKKNAEEGNIVNPVAFNGSFSLCDMADLADLEVSLDIQERDISKVFRSQKCQVRAEAYPGRQYEGVVDRLMPIADRAKGAIPVRVKVRVPKAEEGVFLKPEMGAIVTFLGSAPKIETQNSEAISNPTAETKPAAPSAT